MLVHTHISGGRTKLSSQLLTMLNSTRYAVTSAQQARSQLQIVIQQNLANTRTADTLAIDLKRLGIRHTKAMAFPSLTQERVVTATVTAEAKIIAHNEMFYRNAFEQQLFDELIGRERSESLVETQAQHPINTRRLKQPNLLTKTRQARWRVIRFKKLIGLWLKDDCHTGQTKLIGFAMNRVKHLLMPAVHTIEITDCGNAAAMLIAQIMKPSDQFHSDITPLWSTVYTSAQVYRIEAHWIKTYARKNQAV